MSLINKKLSQNSPKELIHTEGSMCFWVSNGPVLKNLVDLRSTFETMTNDQFVYHVNADKNDFANWVEGALHEPVLAAKLRSYKSQKTMYKVIKVYLKKHYAL